MKFHPFAIVISSVLSFSAWAGPISGAGGGPLGTFTCGTDYDPMPADGALPPTTSFTGPLVNLTFEKKGAVLDPNDSTQMNQIYETHMFYGSGDSTIRAVGVISGQEIDVKFVDSDNNPFGSLKAMMYSSKAINGSTVIYTALEGRFEYRGIMASGNTVDMKCGGQW